MRRGRPDRAVGRQDRRARIPAPSPSGGGDTVVAAANGPELFKGTIATYAPDGRTIVSAGQDQWVMVWDVATRQLRHQVQVGTNIFGFSISPTAGISPWRNRCPGSRSST